MTRFYRFLLVTSLLVLNIYNVKAGNIPSIWLPISSTNPAPNNEEEIFDQVDVSPNFPGGLDSMYTYIKKNLVYPKKALKDSVQGRIYTRIVIEKSGKISKVEVPIGLTEDCNSEAKRIIAKMPAWKPGMKDGKVVRTLYWLPIEFKLTDRVYTLNPDYSEKVIAAPAGKN